MSPIDDELRTALSSRTEPVGLSPDFFTGVERRARGLRRRKVAATVAGSALAVSALGLGGPVVASLLTTSSGTTPGPVASAQPTLSPAPAPAAPYVLDPASPWPYRGDPDLAVQGDVDAYEAQWGAVHGLLVDDFVLTPLFGRVDEPSGTPEVVYLVTTGAGEHWWGVAAATESGPELLHDVELSGPTTVLLAALPGDEEARLLGVAAPGTSLEYGPDSASEWTAMVALADGVGTTALDGDEADDQVRVLGPDGAPLTMVAAPSLAGAAAPGASPSPGSGTAEDEGPGTDTPVAVDPAAYAFQRADPWAYRGPAELSRHPGLGAEATRLFAEPGDGRDVLFSERPLAAVELEDGLSVLMVLHTYRTTAVVSTTWQRGDEPAQQTTQRVEDGTLVVQSVVPQPDGSPLVVALASPRTGAVESDARDARTLQSEQGLAVLEVASSRGTGDLLLYSGGDGLLFHSEPLRRS